MRTKGTVHAHPQTPLEHRYAASVSGLRPPWRVGRVGPATALVGSALAVLALTLLLLALAGAGVGRDSTSLMGPVASTGTPLILPGGAVGIEKRGIVHAPSGYSPPGIWRAWSGPGPLGKAVRGPR
jgi:hypothetical protein